MVQRKGCGFALVIARGLLFVCIFCIATVGVATALTFSQTNDSIRAKDLATAQTTTSFACPPGYSCMTQSAADAKWGPGGYITSPNGTCGMVNSVNEYCFLPRLANTSVIKNLETIATVPGARVAAQISPASGGVANQVPANLVPANQVSNQTDRNAGPERKALNPQSVPPETPVGPAGELGPPPAGNTGQNNPFSGLSVMISENPVVRAIFSLFGGPARDSAQDIAGTCGPDQVMKNGICTCVDPTLKACGAACVNQLTDPANCGECGSTCVSDQVCQGGACTCSIGGKVACGGTCTDIKTDLSNCGTCGNRCPQRISGPVSRCTAGSCGCENPHMTMCGAGCVDLDRNQENCGSCGHSCPAGSNCHNGVCEEDTMGFCKGYAASDSSGTLYDLSSDPMKCGSCQVSCFGDQICYRGTCVAKDSF